MKKAWDTKIFRGDWSSLVKILESVAEGEKLSSLLQSIVRDYVNPNKAENPDAKNSIKLQEIRKQHGMQEKDWENITKIMNTTFQGHTISNDDLRTEAENLAEEIKDKHGVTAEDMHLAGFVKLAMKKKKHKEGPFTGGRDIMKKLVKRLRREQGLPVIEKKPGYKTDGFGIIQKEVMHHEPPEKAQGLGNGFDVMQQVKKHPVKIKKSMDPLETYPVSERPLIRE